jgi:hypothetical protein
MARVQAHVAAEPLGMVQHLVLELSKVTQNDPRMVQQIMCGRRHVQGLLTAQKERRPYDRLQIRHPLGHGGRRNVLHVRRARDAPLLAHGDE